MRAIVIVLTVAGCGRIGFDLTSGAGGDGGGDGNGDGAAEGAIIDANQIANLVVRYPMDDDPAGGTINASLPTYDTTCSACPSAATGHLDGAYRFTGTQRFIIPSNTLVGAASFTVALWMNQTVTNTMIGTLLVKPLSTASTLDATSLWVDASDRMVFSNAVNTSSDHLVTTDVVGAWRHIAASWDGLRKRVYVDGVEVGSQGNGFSDSAENIQVGCDSNTGTPTEFFIGELDDLAFYDRTLMPSEIMLLAQQ